MSIPATKLKAFVNSVFLIPTSLFLISLAVSCGAPGEPQPPSPPIPTAITDLVAHQAGDGVQLTFTVPGKSVAGDHLAEPPAVEIYRGSLNSKGSPDLKTFRDVYTIPGALVSKYLSEGHLQFTDPIAPEETKAHPGAVLAYLVRTRASQKRASADSNVVTLRVFPVAQRIVSIEARVSETAVELSWPAPAQTSAGETLSSAPTYHLYRGELASGSVDTASRDIAEAKWKTKPALLASPDSNQYADTAFDFGKDYVYTVRAVVLSENQPLESNDSSPAIVSPRDTFPPGAPQNLSAAVVPGESAATVQVDLSWSINLEADLAGYRVYRSEEEGTRGQLVNSELLPTPALRDNSVQPGHHYWYSVIAVDRAGNESSPSATLAVDAAQPKE